MQNSFQQPEIGVDDHSSQIAITPPPTPVVRFRQVAAYSIRRDSGYGTDSVASPASTTSARTFSFSDSPFVQGDDISRNIECLSLGADGDSEIHSEDVFEQCSYILGSDDGPCDEDLEVANISDNALSSPIACSRPRAPEPVGFLSSPGSDILVGSDPGSTGAGMVFNRRCPFDRYHEANGTDDTRSHVFAHSDELENPVSRDRSMSLPDALSLGRLSRARWVGSCLRRMSDEFYFHHIRRRRSQRFTVRSPTFPVFVNIDVYASQSYSDHEDFE